MTLVALLFILNALPIPVDVESECEDHTAAYRTIGGHSVVFDCESPGWLSEDDYIERHDDPV